MLQFITHTNERYDYYTSAQAALEGGCRWIQLRMKEAGDDEILAVAHPLRALCNRYGATLILDDKVELVSKCKADGVHLGKNDMPPREARRILGEKAIIGGTANSIDDIDYLVASGVNYIGLGPFRFTETKKKLSPILGIEGYRHILQACRDKGYPLPIVAIGGITLDDIPRLMTTGIAGIALSGTILNAEKPAEETRKIIESINNNKL
ncbi:MAG TPA: thiamine phosphate synthase [Candidatus Caccoplasma merdavium]|nr:thiamine phosphate synthase [Candidatus Caccoplasma merdavium]